MKKIITIVTFIGLILLSAPACAAYSSLVTARCNREFTFVYPTRWVISYGAISDTETVGMKDFLCYENEVLLLSIQVGEFVHETGKGRLPVAVSCEKLNTGFDGNGSSQVILNVAKKDWDNAKPGNYNGELIWVVTSSRTNEVLGKYVTQISTKVPLPPSSDENPKTGDEYFNQLPICAALGVLFLLRLCQGLKMGKKCNPNEI
ncbi:MAG TPA: hypothetical protein GXX17_08155 [Clostridiales bacterium]|nr:hypothetical protein [Clostridiales bacterium]